MDAAKRMLSVAAALAIGALTLTACGGTTGQSSGSDQPDELTMWARSSTQDYTQALVDAYNESHDTQIKLTIVASDSFQQKVGAAAGVIAGGRKSREDKREHEQQSKDQVQAAQTEQRATFKKALGTCMQGRGYTTG